MVVLMLHYLIRIQFKSYLNHLIFVISTCRSSGKSLTKASAPSKQSKLIPVHSWKSQDNYLNDIFS